MNEVNFMDVTLLDRGAWWHVRQCRYDHWARVAELVYAAGLGPVGFGLVGSTPTPGTTTRLVHA